MKKSSKKKQTKNINFAKNLIFNYLSNDNPYALGEIATILDEEAEGKFDRLLEHINALLNILNDARKDIEVLSNGEGA